MSPHLSLACVTLSCCLSRSDRSTCDGDCGCDCGFFGGTGCCGCDACQKDADCNEDCHASAYFTVDGPCTVDGACARSPNYPSNYSNSQTCTIRPTSLAVGQLLSATAFNTDSGFDKLIVNGATYDGTTGPSNVLLGSAFTWSSDSEVPGAGWEVCAQAVPPAMPPSPPPPASPKPPCATPIDFILVLDESGSMKPSKRSPGSMEGLEAFAKLLVNQFALGVDAARFSVVSFASIATTRVPWSYNAAVINAGIDQMSADGKTSISGGFEAAGILFANARPNATKVVLLISDGEQSEGLAAEGKTPLETAIDAATLVTGSGVTVFAWGFGEKVALTTLEMIATDSSKAVRVNDLVQLSDYLEGLVAAVCNESPPSWGTPRYKHSAAELSSVSHSASYLRR